MKDTIIFYKKDSGKMPEPVRIACLGDSITNGVCSNTDPADGLNIKGSFMPYYRWWEKDYDVAAINYGQNGSFVAEYRINKCPTPNDSVPFVLRYKDMTKDSGLITVMGGVNDCQAGYYTPEEFGSAKDVNNKDIHTFCGALRSMLKGLCKEFPKAQTVYLSPLRYSDVSDGLGAVWKNASDMPHYIDAMRIICKESGVHFIDLYTPSELHFCCDNKDDKLVYGDRLHFGWKAHKLLSRFILDKMEAMGIVRIVV